MWVLTSADKPALYNVSAFEVMTTGEDAETGGYHVVATDRHGGEGRQVSLAHADDPEGAENVLRVIAEELGALALGRVPSRSGAPPYH